MRERFLSGGGRGMATYELLEMLLYYVIPYRDTKPTATELLERFGGLDGVLRASAESLAEVSGVGRVCAEFLRSVGRITLLDDLFGLLGSGQILVVFRHRAVPSFPFSLLGFSV